MVSGGFKWVPTALRACTSRLVTAELGLFCASTAYGGSGEVVNGLSTMSTLSRRPEVTELDVPHNSSDGGDGSDELEGALLRAYKLIESTVIIHRRRTAQRSELPLGTHPGRSEDAVGRLVGLARRSVGVVLAEHDEQTEAVCAALEKLGAARREGLAVRVLCSPRAHGADAVRALGRRGPAPEIRVAAAAVQQAVIVDGRIALVPADGQSADGWGSAVQDPAVVRVIESLFAGAWSSAMSRDEYNRLGGRARTASARRILHCLSTGLTDEVAARDMGVSLRTYRRHVAEIMRALGANSRFQAGARAVEFGLMSGTD